MLLQAQLHATGLQERAHIVTNDQSLEKLLIQQSHSDLD